MHVCGGRVGTPGAQVAVDSEFSAAQAAVESMAFLRFQDLGALLSCSHYSVDLTGCSVSSTLAPRVISGLPFRRLWPPRYGVSK